MQQVAGRDQWLTMLNQCATLLPEYKLERVAPGHCTGEPEFAALKRVFGDHYVYAGVGSVVDLPAATSARTASRGP
jgi:7,8-dihydropterin-6-yl-methyl-4-(beta-D-ribofuranosyl)aminobenzene 5'-phosphate synthase